MLKNGFRVFENADDISAMSVFEQLLSLPEMVEYASKTDVGEYGPAKKICMFGIGPSAIAGDVISVYADCYSEIPVVNVSNGILPGWVDEDTDVILISYTGKNKIINRLYDSVKNKNHSLTCITSGDEVLLRLGYVSHQCPARLSPFGGLVPRKRPGARLGLFT